MFNKLISFDAVFMALHGHPSENGLIQPYFDKLNIPYTCCNAKKSALTYNKIACNKELKKMNYNCAKSYIHSKDVQPTLIKFISIYYPNKE